MKFEEALSRLKPVEQRLHGEFEVDALYIFGSVARGDETLSSDLAMLVDFKNTPTFALFMDLRFFLEDLLGARVDLVTRKALRPSMRKQIEEEARHVA